MAFQGTRRIGADIGGTFTDVALDVDGRLYSTKVLTEHAAPERAIIRGAEIVVAEAGLRLSDIDLLIHGTTLATNALIERKGAIVNLSSVAATYPYRGGAVYAGTKAFVRQFSLGLRCDLQGTGVRVTSIEPGMVETEFTVVRTGGNQAASDALYAGMNPMTAEDIAETVAWVTALPRHVNINRVEMMPTCQAAGPLAIKRQG